MSHTIESDLVALIEKIAIGEQRNRSNMVEVLLREAVAARESKASVAELSSVKIAAPSPPASPRPPLPNCRP